MMATQFAMPAPSMGPTTPYTTSPTQYNPFAAQSQPISPISSSNTTPQNSSPTSPRGVLPLPSHPQQLRPLKSPLYVPAVLRPTDPPRRAAVKASPITPPQSMNSSFDNLQNARPLSRTSTVDSGKFGLGNISETGWNLSDFPKVTDSPTRKHWKVRQFFSLYRLKVLGSVAYSFASSKPCTGQLNRMFLLRSMSLVHRIMA